MRHRGAQPESRYGKTSNEAPVRNRGFVGVDLSRERRRYRRVCRWLFEEWTNEAARPVTTESLSTTTSQKAPNGPAGASCRRPHYVGMSATFSPAWRWVQMRRKSQMTKLFGLITSAALLAAASAYAQSATPIEGNPSPARPAQAAPGTTGAGSPTTSNPGAMTRQPPVAAPGTASPYGATGGATGAENPDRVVPRQN
jgi:hypothetical protein